MDESLRTGAAVDNVDHVGGLGEAAANPNQGVPLPDQLQVRMPVSLPTPAPLAADPVHLAAAAQALAEAAVTLGAAAPALGASWTGVAAALARQRTGEALEACRATTLAALEGCHEVLAGYARLLSSAAEAYRHFDEAAVPGTGAPDATR